MSRPGPDLSKLKSIVGNNNQEDTYKDYKPRDQKQDVYAKKQCHSVFGGAFEASSP